MKLHPPATFLFLFLFLLPVPQALSSEQLVRLLNEHGADFISRARLVKANEGTEVFGEFVRMLSDALDKEGETGSALELRKFLSDPQQTGVSKSDLGWIIHTYAREFYKEEIIRATGELIRFRTYATDVPNRENPEFLRQKEYLRALASRLGLHFNDADGFIQEIWIGEGEESFGIMSHSDVQPVDESEWSHDPWSGDVIDGAIWGRGSVDDKGPICAVLFGMKALLDSGIPLKRRIVLLVGTDEESANQDVSTYLGNHKAPDETIVVDSNYPVVCAEKGWGGIWLSLPREIGNPGGEGLRVLSIQSGFSPSIVPEKATARLIPEGKVAEGSIGRLKDSAEGFMNRRAGSMLDVKSEGDTIILTASGKSVHSSVPATGHNALMDLLVFIDRDVHPLENEFSLMAKFAATYIGFETDGKSLGISHHDDFMGDVTVAADMFEYSDTTVTLMFNFRRPKGIDKETVESELQSRFDEFGRAHGVTFSDTRYIGEPHFRDPDMPFIRRLLDIYNGITGENRKAQSIGGGTYAQRIPNAVVFGPALPDEEYLGHQPDEHFRISTLMRNIEILTHTMVEFGM